MAQLTNISTSTLSNQNISSALLLHTFTNTTRLRKIYIDVFADQLAGNGNYVIYATRQRSGAGSAYEVGARTTVAVPSGITAQMFPTIALMAGATDVIKVYLVGLAGDTTTPDIITDVSEEFINVDASGNPTPNNSSGVTTILADYARRTGDYATVAALATLQGNVTTILADYARRTGDYATVAALSTLQGNVTTILADYARRTGDYSTLTTGNIPTAAQNATALLDAANGVETSFTLRQAMRLMLAALAGKLSISGNTVTIRDVNDTVNRIVATTDADGQRTAVTKDVS